ncbi:MAG: hypothetical protein GX448_11785 [Planctomycetes bacterium]|nr:hypothetical protein [Planctomycetota bacterium]
MRDGKAVYYELLVLIWHEESRAILGVLYRGQFQSQEKLLEIECRLADLAERLDAKGGGRDSLGECRLTPGGVIRSERATAAKARPATTDCPAA